MDETYIDVMILVNSKAVANVSSHHNVVSELSELKILNLIKKDQQVDIFLLVDLYTKLMIRMHEGFIIFDENTFLIK